MEFLQATPTYAALGKLFEKRAAVLFCGAGISMEPPAGLSSWQKVRDYTLEAIGSRDPFVAQYTTQLSALPLLAGADQKSLSLEFIASLLINPKAYFDSLRSLQDGSCNINHLYVAALAKAGYLRYLVTTNTDLFLEHACERERLAYRVYRTEEEFAVFNLDEAEQDDGKITLHIFKMHGCIGLPVTIVSKGESPTTLTGNKRDALSQLCTRYCPVFLGYSGRDLEIHLDYLGLVGTKEQTPGLFWIARPDPEGNPHVMRPVQELMRLYQHKAQLLAARLPEFWEDLLLPASRIQHSHYTEEQVQALSDLKNEKLKNYLEFWAEKSMDPDQVCHIVGLLLKQAGLFDGAIQCLERYSALAREIGDELALATALYDLGTIYQAKGQYDKALTYYQDSGDLAHLSDDQQQIANLEMSIALVHEAKDVYEKALHHKRSALQILDSNGDFVRASAISFQMGLIHENKLQEIGEAILSYIKSITYASAAKLLDHTADTVYERLLACQDRLLQLPHEDKLGIAHRERQKIFSGLTVFGHNALANGRPQQALHCYGQAMSLAQLLGDDSELMAACNNIGSIYQEMANYPQAIAYYQKALELADKSQETGSVAVISENMATVYQEYLHDIPKAIECYEKSLACFQVAGLDDEMQDIQQKLDDCKKQLGQEVSKEHRTGHDLAPKFQELMDKGASQLTARQYPKALNYFYQALEMSLQMGNLAPFAQALAGLGELALQLESGSHPQELYEKLYSYFEWASEVALRMAQA